MKSWIRMAIIGIWAAGVVDALAAPYVVLNDGTRRVGTRISARPDGTVVLTTESGQFEFARGQYRAAVADKPADFDATIAAAGKAATADGAIPALTKIIRELRNLEWDKPAAQALVRIYTGKKEFAPAAKVMEDLLAVYPTLESDPDYGWLYRQALLNAGQIKKLETKLADLVAKGSPADTARALIMRGDIRAGEEKMEYAIRDYLRAVLFFERERAVMPEALSKAAAALEKARDPRSKNLYQQLVRDYPNSPEAAAAKGKI
ncbi:MAG: hypothetical protein KBA51_04620 [Kiritimatiellae bacterium]|nr:hypothetical protein [Kiritimatiellia bacterium]